MNDFSGMELDFVDWKNVVADVYQESTSTDIYGEVSTVRTLIDEDVKCGKWIESTQQTTESDKFVGQELGWLFISSPGYKIDVTYVFVIDSVDYYVTGFKNMGQFGEIYLVSYRKEHL